MAANVINFSIIKRIFEWRSIVGEVAGVTLMAGAYTIIVMSSQDPNLGSISQWATSILPSVTTILLIIVIVSFLSASSKSLLPAAVAALLFLPLYLFGMPEFAKLSQAMAGGAALTHGLAFLIRGKSLSETGIVKGSNGGKPSKSH